MSSYIDWGEEVDRYYKYHSSKKNPWSSLLSQISDTVAQYNYQAGQQNVGLAQSAVQQGQLGVSQLYSQYMRGKQTLSGSGYGDAYKAGVLGALGEQDISGALGQQYGSILQQAQAGLTPGTSLEENEYYKQLYVTERDKAKNIFGSFFSYFAPEGADADTTLAHLEQQGYMKNGELTGKGLLYFKSYFANADTYDESDPFFAEHEKTLGQYLRGSVEGYHDKYIEEILGDMLGVDFTTGEFSDAERKKIFGDAVTSYGKESLGRAEDYYLPYVYEDAYTQFSGTGADLDYQRLYLDKLTGKISEEDFNRKVKEKGLTEGSTQDRGGSPYTLSHSALESEVKNYLNNERQTTESRLSPIVETSVQADNGTVGYVLTAEETNRLLTGGKTDDKEGKDRFNIYNKMWDKDETKGIVNISGMSDTELLRLGGLRNGDTYRQGGITYIIYNGQKRVFLDKETLKTIQDNVDRNYLHKELGIKRNADYSYKYLFG